MPKKLTYEFVSEFIKSKGYTLISEEYINNNKKLDMKCKICDKIFKQAFSRFQEGYYHQFCQTDLLFGGYKTPVRLKSIICAHCKKECQPRSSKTKMCSLQCRKEYEKTNEEYKKKASEKGKISGKLSAASQQRRSKNEIYFAELCEDYYGKDKIITNQPYFDGWDADIIIHDFKLAILWNGIWHYKKILEKQNLVQIQARDKVKFAIIQKYGYTPYIIKDLGKHDKKFVEQEFEIFKLMQMEI